MRQIAGVRQQLKSLLFESGFISKRKGMSKKQVKYFCNLFSILICFFLKKGIG